MELLKRTRRRWRVSLMKPQLSKLHLFAVLELSIPQRNRPEMWLTVTLLTHAALTHALTCWDYVMGSVQGAIRRTKIDNKYTTGDRGLIHILVIQFVFHSDTLFFVSLLKNSAIIRTLRTRLICAHIAQHLTLYYYLAIMWQFISCNVKAMQQVVW